MKSLVFLQTARKHFENNRWKVMTIRLESPLGIIAHHAMWQCSWSNRSLDKMFDEPNKMAAKGKHAFPEQRSFACLSRSDTLKYCRIIAKHTVYVRTEPCN